MEKHQGTPTQLKQKLKDGNQNVPIIMESGVMIPD